MSREIRLLATRSAFEQAECMQMSEHVSPVKWKCYIDRVDCCTVDRNSVEKRVSCTIFVTHLIVNARTNPRGTNMHMHATLTYGTGRGSRLRATSNSTRRHPPI